MQCMHRGECQSRCAPPPKERPPLKPPERPPLAGARMSACTRELACTSARCLCLLLLLLVCLRWTQGLGRTKFTLCGDLQGMCDVRRAAIPRGGASSPPPPARLRIPGRDVWKNLTYEQVFRCPL